MKSKSHHKGDILYVTVHNVSNLEPLFLLRPYVKLAIGRATISTSVEYGRNPVFYQRFALERDPWENTLHVEVWDSGILLKNRFLGSLDVIIAEFFDVERKLILPIIPQEGTGQASIEISIFLCPPGFADVEKIDNRFSSEKDTIITPAQPLYAPDTSLTPALPYYCRMDFPQPDQIIRDPLIAVYFLLSKRTEVKEEEKAHSLELRTQVQSLLAQINEKEDQKRSETNSEKKSRIEAELVQLEEDLNYTMVQLQVMADASMFGLKETEEEALEEVTLRTKEETERFNHFLNIQQNRNKNKGKVKQPKTKKNQAKPKQEDDDQAELLEHPQSPSLHDTQQGVSPNMDSEELLSKGESPLGEDKPFPRHEPP
ncbi:hypothetical protein BLNAU_15572 [Blattamonas nauphoetae]|uniref:C2 domain-containing protein n=1 Tax=Blattamonas nauphoetae TaxID=2049346 RepID=A0ABQ9XDL8_9EUKA|nr:hypothetical protein BLNAU_15572 [Blattamonas nauphoetae]